MSQAKETKLNKTLRAVLLVNRDCVKVITGAICLTCVLLSVLYLSLTLAMSLVDGHLVTMSEDEGYGIQAIRYETYFFYVVLSCWLAVGIYFFTRAVQKKKQELPD